MNSERRSHETQMDSESQSPDDFPTALQGKRILVVMGSYPGKRPMYERAQQLGVKLVVLDGPGHWTQADVTSGLFEDFIEVDLYPSGTLADRAYQAVINSGYQFDGVATFEEFAGPLAALLAQGLNLPGHPFLSVAYCRDKTFTREICVEAGIPSPRFFRIRSAGDLAQAAQQVGFPAVLKPVSGASSVATYRLNSAAELSQRYHQTIDTLQEHLKLSGVHSDDEQELIWANGFDMTLEQFLDGEEFDVDVLLSTGRVVYAAVTRDLPQPYLREIGSQMPPDFPDDKQAELIAFTAEVLKVLGFKDGAFHVETKYTSEGPRLIEVNARIGGGPIYLINRLVWGIDLAEQYLLTRLGVPIQPRKSSHPQTFIITSDLPCPYSGVLANADFLTPIANHPRLIHSKTYVTAGQFVVGPDQGVPDSLGELMVYGDSISDASQTMESLLGAISFPIVPA